MVTEAPNFILISDVYLMSCLQKNLVVASWILETEVDELEVNRSGLTPMNFILKYAHECALHAYSFNLRLKQEPLTSTSPMPSGGASLYCLYYPG